MKKSVINITIESDENNVPEHIEWAYNEKKVVNPAPTDGILLAVWDKQDKKSIHVDLWTKDMTMSEMHQLIFQTMITLADTYKRATGNNVIADKMLRLTNELEQDLAR
jgi:gliding motility-associated protein GldC